MKKTGRAILFYAPRDIRLEEIPVPSPGPGEILVKVKTALTCGTDFKAYQRGHPVLLKRLPSAFGHEWAGVVEETGAGIANFKPGDRIVAANSAPCQNCYFCRLGQEELCDNLFLYNGAYADYALIAASIARLNTHLLPNDMEFTAAALAEPLACVLHGLDASRVQEGESVVLIGSGPMAILILGALKEKKARVCVIGRGPENLAIAKKAGADQVLSVLEGDPGPAIRDWTSGFGADCVFEASGFPQNAELALDIVRKGGRVCLFAGCAPETKVSIDPHKIHYREISLIGVFHHAPRYFRAALDLLASGKIKTEFLISGKISLNEIPAYFARVCDLPRSKVAVLP